MAKTKHKKQQVRRRMLKRRARNSAHRRRKDSNGPPRSALALCKVNSRWREGGAAVLVVARRKENGALRWAIFYIDVLGVGIKDCFRRQDCPQADLEFWLKHTGEEIGSFETCSEELAQQLIWGGFYYGRQNGFRPPREFSQCKKLIPFLREEQVNWELFGKDGKPLIIGDYRDLLRRSGGKFDPEDPRFHYIMGLPPQELDKLDPWEVLLEEAEGLPPGKERVLLIEGTYFGNDFESLFEELIQWEDLDLLEEDKQYALFGWSRAYPKNHWNPFSKMPGARQSLGQLKIEDEMLTVSVRGKSWMLIMNERLGEAFGLELARGPLDIQDPMELNSSGAG